jgi:hypothetical protein
MREEGKEVNEYIRAFPYRAIDGVCEMYKEGVGCLVYKKRPALCNVKRYYKKYFSDKMTLEAFYGVNKEICKELRLVISADSD